MLFGAQDSIIEQAPVISIPATLQFTLLFQPVLGVHSMPICG
jgi:hypothetical protein